MRIRRTGRRERFRGEEERVGVERKGSGEAKERWEWRGKGGGGEETLTQERKVEIRE